MSANSLIESLNKIFYGVGILLNKINLFYNKQNIEINLFYKNQNSIYKGESFILAATVISFCKYLNFRNSRLRFKISGASAFTGSIDSEGNLLKLHEASIEAKITAVFFSWVRNVIVPFDNLQVAEKVINTLKIEYPNRKLNVIGLKHLSDIFSYNDVLKKEMDSYTEYSYKIIKKHFVLSSVLFAVIMFIIGLILAFNFLPKNIKPLPQIKEDYSLIYTPDRETKWIFNNADYFCADTIDFGDAAIGDQKYVSIDFWNNSEDAEGFISSLDGSNANEFDYTFHISNSQPDAPDKIFNSSPGKIYLKFIPFKEEGKKEAKFVIRNKKKEFSKEIFLKGNSKRLNNGYCIDFANKGHILTIESKANFVKENSTLSFWIKPYFAEIPLNSGISILRVDKNPQTNNKLNLSASHDSSLSLFIPGSKSLEKEHILVANFGKLKFNEWNYIALSIGDTSFSLILNNSSVSKTMKKGTIRIFDDYIYLGALHPDERSAENIGNIENKFFYFFDEFKIFNKHFEANDLIKKRFSKDFANDNIMLHYTFDDATHNTVFDNTANDFFGRIYGGARRIIDTSQPYNSIEKYNSVSKSGNTYVKTYGKGFLKLNKNIFKPNNSFTIQCDFFAAENDKPNSSSFSSVFYFNRPGLDVTLKTKDDSLIFNLTNKSIDFFALDKYPYPQPNKWNKFTFIFNYEKNEYYLYVNEDLVFSRKGNFQQNIIANYMGVSFASLNYFSAPRYYNLTSFIDN